MTISNTTIAIQLPTAPVGDVDAVIKNSSGSTVQTVTLVDRGDNFYSENVTALSEGVYFVVFQDDNTKWGTGQLIWDGAKEHFPIELGDIIGTLLDNGLIEFKGGQYIFTKEALQKGPIAGGGSAQGNRLHDPVWTRAEKEKIRKALGLEEDIVLLDRIKKIEMGIDELPMQVKNIMYKIEAMDKSLGNFITDISLDKPSLDFTPIFKELEALKNQINNIDIPVFDDSNILDNFKVLQELTERLNNQIGEIDTTVDMDTLLDSATIEIKEVGAYTTILSIKQALERLVRSLK